MDIEEVIYDLEYLISNNCTYTQIIDYVEEIELAIKALEKQIPKKPKPTEEQNTRYAMNYTCPFCEKHFSGTGIADYCYHCGQALDWGDYDE